MHEDYLEAGRERAKSEKRNDRFPLIQEDVMPGIDHER